MKRKYAAFILAIVMILSAGSSFAFAGSGETTGCTYLSIGDSSNVGYALEHYYDVLDPESGATADTYAAFDCVVPDSVPDHVTKYLKTQYDEVTTLQYGMPALRVCDLRLLLDPTVQPDTFFKSTLYGAEGAFRKAVKNTPLKEHADELGMDVILAYLRDLYKEAVQKADIITYELGNNDLYTYVMNSIMSLSTADTEEDMNTLLKSLGTSETMLSLRTRFMEKLKGLLPASAYEGLPATLQKMIDALIFGYLDSTLNLDKTLDIIYEWNPDVEIVVCGMENSSQNLLMDFDGFTVSVGAMTDVFVKSINAYRMLESRYAGRYRYCDLSECRIEQFSDAFLMPTYSAEVQNAAEKILLTCNVYYPAMPPFLQAQILNNFRTGSASNTIKMKYFMSSDNTEAMTLAGTYLVSGPDSLTEEERTAAKNYLTYTRLFAMGLGVHPDTNGYETKADAFIAAIADDANAREYGVEKAVDNLVEVGKTCETIVKASAEIVRQEVKNDFVSAVEATCAVIHNTLTKIGSIIKAFTFH